jgi:hypothetical protein
MGQVIGRVLSTHASAGTYVIDLFPAEIKTAAGAIGGGGSTLLTAGSDGNVGCIFCDGQARYLAPGVPFMVTGNGCPPSGNAPAAHNMVSVPMPAGTLTNLRVKASRVDQDAHGYFVSVNDPCNPGGTGSLSCNTYGPSFPPTQHFDSCQSPAGGSLHINAGDRIAIGIADGGATFDDGLFSARFSMQFTPDP